MAFGYIKGSTQDFLLLFCLEIILFGIHICEVSLDNYLPVIISVLIIVSVAVLEKHSKLIAAVTATMPIKVPLALWVVFAAHPEEPRLLEGFSRSLLVGIFPTIGFLIAAWLGFKKGMKLLPTILLGYLVWGIGVGLSFVFRTYLGV